MYNNGELESGNLDTLIQHLIPTAKYCPDVSILIIFDILTCTVTFTDQFFLLVFCYISSVIS